MNVSLISYTKNALDLLLFTKQTRLKMDAGLMAEIQQWDDEKKAEHLDYMLKTIESSWEFVDFTFSIERVSRAFTHQLVRTRDGSYAQQSQRTVDMTGFEYVLPEALEGSKMEDSFHGGMEDINDLYQQLIQEGANPQDARAVLPTNVATNIICKFNLATLSRMAEKRLCSRTQGEYQMVFRRMRELVIEVYPWAEPFIRVACAKRGVCQFPAYKECPIKPGMFNPDTGLLWPALPGQLSAFTEEEWRNPLLNRLRSNMVPPLTKAEIQVRWNGMKFEAVPHAGGAK